MADAVNEQDLARDHERYKQLLRSTFVAFILTFIIGGIGAFLLYMFLPEGKIPLLVLLIPALLTVLVTCLPIRKRKKEWFPTPESLMAASQYKPPKS